MIEKGSLDKDIRDAVDVMRRGGLILYPTDTVWGIGCDATCEEAVRKVYDLKRRVDSKALITLVSDVGMLERYVDDIPEVAYQLIDCAVKPLTIVYDRGVGVAPSLLAGDGSIGVRVTSETYSRRLCIAMRRPVVSTSANISGQPAPAFFRQISREILEGVDYVAYYRRDDITPAVPSSVIKVSSGGLFTIIR